MRRSIKKFFTISTIAFVILYPCLFMYFQNADEAKLIDALPAFEKFLALAIVVFVICIIFMKNTGKAVLASDVILFILTNFKQSRSCDWKKKDNCNFIFYNIYVYDSG